MYDIIQRHKRQMLETFSTRKKRPLIIEDAEFLKKFGIYIPGKEGVKNAILKYYPEDFIVEEIDPNNELATIEQPRQDTVNTYSDCKNFTVVLVKKNMRTIDCVNDISNQLGVTKENINYYGLKDDDAVTAQFLAIKNTSFEKLKLIKSDHFFIKQIKEMRDTIVPGKNKGNRFTIIIRFVSEKDRDFTLSKIADKKDYQFLNYFYTQRFNAPRLSNFYWAILLMQGRYEESLKEFLTQTSTNESPHEIDLRKQILENYGDWQIVDDFLKNESFFDKEKEVIKSLASKQTIKGALNSINDQIKLWCYALGSWFFNHKIMGLLLNNQNIPEELPMYLSTKEKDFSIYKNFAETLGIYPPDTHLLKRDFNIDSFGSKVKTRTKAVVHSVEKNEKKNIRIIFDLPTGSYATTFLSNFINIMSGDTSGQDIEK